ncbi:MAG: hypothetical protein KJ737_21795 [Proteobacteria bacterium]|nr:hypothetical protein [Pseudomonadota bacterium]
MKKQILIYTSLCSIFFVILAQTHAANRIYHLGPVEIELMPGPQTDDNTISFKLMNTSGSSVRYFSVTCKIMKDGYLIDERTCNGFGIEPNSFKEVKACFFWLPPAYDIDFEANKIRTEQLDIARNGSPASLTRRTEPIETDNVFEDKENPRVLIDGEYEIGRKYTIYNEGSWFSEGN